MSKWVAIGRNFWNSFLPREVTPGPAQKCPVEPPPPPEPGSRFSGEVVVHPPVPGAPSHLGWKVEDLDEFVET